MLVLLSTRKPALWRESDLLGSPLLVTPISMSSYHGLKAFKSNYLGENIYSAKIMPLKLVCIPWQHFREGVVNMVPWGLAGNYSFGGAQSACSNLEILVNYLRKIWYKSRDVQALWSGRVRSGITSYVNTFVSHQSNTRKQEPFCLSARYIVYLSVHQSFSLSVNVSVRQLSSQAVS